MKNPTLITPDPKKHHRSFSLILYSLGLYISTNSENITVYDSEIIGEYLAWHSKNVRLVNCLIGETQPLCYCENLVLENCRFRDDADLAFEYSDVNATINGHVTSIKNPRSGSIKADSVGEIILDDNIKPPADCKITTTNA